MTTTQILALAVLLGSIPIRQVIAGRTGRKASELTSMPLALALILDAAKGFVPVYLARVNLDSDPLVALAGALVLLSDCFPYWLMFRPQGLGRATALGVIIGLNPLAGVCTLGIALAAMGLPFRRWAPIIAAFSAPIWLRVFGSPTAHVALALAICAWALIAHFAQAIINQGTEPREKAEQ